MEIAAWDRMIEAFYRDTFSPGEPEHTVAAMGELLATFDADDAGALVPFEMAGVHDSLGREDAAVPLYREALGAGLNASHEVRARIQLASTPRNLGRLLEALELLSVRAQDDLESARKTAPSNGTQRIHPPERHSPERGFP